MAIVIDISITAGDSLRKLRIVEIRRRQLEAGEFGDYDVFLYEPDGLKTEIRTAIHDYPRERGALELARVALNELRAIEREREFHDAERDRVDWEVTS